MIVTLSPGFMRDKPSVEAWVQHAAKSIGCHYRVKWVNDRSCRGVLVRNAIARPDLNPDTGYVPATDMQHDAFIAEIFRLDSEAYVRTALATYNTKAEFINRLPLEGAR